MFYRKETFCGGMFVLEVFFFFFFLLFLAEFELLMCRNSIVKISEKTEQAELVENLLPLLKNAYSNIFKLSSSKIESSDKNSDIFHISAQNIDCGYSLEPCIPQFYCIKVGFKGVKII